MAQRYASRPTRTSTTCLTEAPDIVFLATGGVPNTDILESGGDLVVSTWDILSGVAKPAQRVLIYDDNGAHPAMQAAELAAESGSTVEIVTPERYFAPEIGGLNHAAYAEVFHRHNVRITINARVMSVHREGNALRASIGSDHGPERFDREVDQVVVEHGTLPITDLYEALRPLSVNLGEVDYEALLAHQPQAVVRNSKPRSVSSALAMQSRAATSTPRFMMLCGLPRTFDCAGGGVSV